MEPVSSIEELSSVAQKLSFTIPAATVDQALDHAYREIRKEAKVPGFRPGRAPRKTLERRFGKQVDREVAAKLMAEALAEGLKLHQIDPVGEPAYDQQPLKQGRPFSFSAVVQVKPVITLTDLSLTIDRAPAAEPTDAEVDQQLEHIRMQKASFEIIAEVRSAADGDVAECSAAFTAAGLGEHRRDNLLVSLPDDSDFPYLVPLLMGLQRGQQQQAEVTLPADYADPAWAGKTCEVTLQLHDLRRAVLPALADGFAVELGHESLAELKQAIRDSISAARAERYRAITERAIIEQLLEQNPFEVPSNLIDLRVSTLLGAISKQLLPDLAAEPTLDDLEEDKRADLRQEAEHSVRRELILAAVAHKEGLLVTEDDLRRRIGAIARQTGQPRDTIAGYLRDSGEMPALQARILEDKALDLLIARASNGA